MDSSSNYYVTDASDAVWADSPVRAFLGGSEQDLSWSSQPAPMAAASTRQRPAQAFEKRLCTAIQPGWMALPYAWMAAGRASGTPSWAATGAIWPTRWLSTAAVRHFAGQPVQFEIWNEPNLDNFWHPSANAGQYDALAREAIERIHLGDPSARVSTGVQVHIILPPSTTGVNSLGVALMLTPADNGGGLALELRESDNPVYLTFPNLVELYMPLVIK